MEEFILLFMLANLLVYILMFVIITKSALADEQKHLANLEARKRKEENFKKMIKY